MCLGVCTRWRASPASPASMADIDGDDPGDAGDVAHYALLRAAKNLKTTVFNCFTWIQGRVDAENAKTPFSRVLGGMGKNVEKHSMFNGFWRGRLFP